MFFNKITFSIITNSKVKKSKNVLSKTYRQTQYEQLPTIRIKIHPSCNELDDLKHLAILPSSGKTNQFKNHISTLKSSSTQPSIPQQTPSPTTNSFTHKKTNPKNQHSVLINTLAGPDCTLWTDQNSTTIHQMEPPQVSSRWIQKAAIIQAGIFSSFSHKNNP